MREIKFRAWDKKEKKMIDWYDLASKFMFFNYIDNPDFPLMQYTGFKDKNGVEIYEGDIVEYFSIVINRKILGKVFWNDQMASWFIKNEFGILEHFALTRNNSDFIKIGNVYDNKELLK